MSSSTQHRLRKHPDYQRVYRTSRKQWAKQIAYFSVPRAPDSQAALRSETRGPRIGLTVPKALGKAVDRNRIKRRLREALRRHIDLLPQGSDLILHPRRSVLTIEFTKLEAEVVRILQQAGTEAARTRAAELAKGTGSPAHGLGGPTQ